MILLLLLTALFLVAAVLGSYHGLTALEDGHTMAEDRSGWVYFITTVGEDEAPVKVGMSSHDPATQRLTELRTMSPYPLRIIYKFQTEDRYQYEAKVHHILEPHKVRGEWYDRDATLALIDALKGEQSGRTSN